MALSLDGLPGRTTGARIAAVAGTLVIAAVAACSISGPGKDTASRNFLDYIEREIIDQDPFATGRLAEYRTGHWSWDVTPIIKAWAGHLEPGETLVGVVERSFPLIAELRRHRESDGPMTGRAYRVNRNQLDPSDTDHKKVYERTYNEYVSLLFSKYELVIYVYAKRGENLETVQGAYLFFAS
ncbi:MAG: hypothetical protein F4103_11300, partial [Boseongicola sp. SB0673_bin_14]|nr:hypothetical protein [Boseongicola sp. SB0673_bin_14]